jgi:hypothetical protein
MEQQQTKQKQQETSTTSIVNEYNQWLVHVPQHSTNNENKKLNVDQRNLSTNPNELEPNSKFENPCKQNIYERCIMDQIHCCFQFQHSSSLVQVDDAICILLKND